MPRIPTAAPTGSPVAWTITRNFSLRNLRIDHDYANNGASAGASIATVTGIILGRAANFVVENCTVRNIYKYGYNVGAAMDYRITNVWGYGPTGATAGAECLKHYGPCRNGTVRGVYGLVTDDGMSIQPNEDATFNAYRWTFGDILSITIEDNCMHTSGGQGVMIVYAGPNYISDNIEIKNINGYGPCQIFALNKNVTDSNCIFGSVTVDGVHGVTSGSGIRPVYVAASGTTTGKRLTIRNVDCTGDGNQIYIGTSLVCDELDIDGVVAASTNATPPTSVFLQGVTNIKKFRVAKVRSTLVSGSAGFLVSVLGTITNGLIEECVLRGSTNMRLAAVAGNNAIGYITIRRNVMDTSGDRVAQCTSMAAGTVINFYDNVFDSSIGLAFPNSASNPIDVTVNHGGNVATASSLGYIRSDRNTADVLTVRLREGAGNRIVNANICVIGASGGGNPQFEVYDPHLQIDVGATGFVKTVSGQIVFNTSAGGARGTLVANRLVTCSGTNWVQIDTPALIF
jgi:hypothetical protein